MMQITIPEQDLANLANFMQRPDIKPNEYPSWARCMQAIQSARRAPGPAEPIVPPMQPLLHESEEAT